MIILPRTYATVPIYFFSKVVHLYCATKENNDLLLDFLRLLEKCGKK